MGDSFRMRSIHPKFNGIVGSRLKSTRYQIDFFSQRIVVNTNSNFNSFFLWIYNWMHASPLICTLWPKIDAYLKWICPNFYLHSWFNRNIHFLDGNSELYLAHIFTQKRGKFVLKWESIAENRFPCNRRKLKKTINLLTFTPLIVSERGRNLLVSIALDTLRTNHFFCYWKLKRFYFPHTICSITSQNGIFDICMAKRIWRWHYVLIQQWPILRRIKNPGENNNLWSIISFSILFGKNPAFHYLQCVMCMSLKLNVFY